MPLSVAMLIQSFHPAIGGTERQALALSKALQARGVRVRVLTRRIGVLPREETVEGVEVRRLAASGKGAWGNATFLLASLNHLLLHGGEYDVFHAHLASSHAIAAALAGKILRKRVLVKLGGGGALGELGQAGRSVAGRAKAIALRWLRPRLVAVSEDQLRDLGPAGLGSLPVSVVPNGVDTSGFRPPVPEERERLREAFGWTGCVFLYVGRFSPDKAPLEVWERFLRGWGSFAGEVPDATLVLVGGGPLAGALQQKGPGEGVRMYGVRRDVAELYRAADVFVLPSSGEGLSNALLEAMASGLPVIASRVPGIEGVVREGVNGILFDPHRPEDLAVGLHHLASSPERRREMGIASRGLAEGYSLEATAERTLALYAGGR